MDSVPHRFCDDVATIMDGFLAINLDQIISKEWRSWRTVFKEHKEKRRTIQITAYAEDHETVRYQVQEHMMAPPPPGFGLALRRSQSFTLDELKKMDKKYIRVRALYVRKKREPNQPMLGLNLPALPLASWNDFICTALWRCVEVLEFSSNNNKVHLFLPQMLIFAPLRRNYLLNPLFGKSSEHQPIPVRLSI
ncbi:hypothetical protein QR680_006930 [Steinernema hermaphroditum]|uniref:Uncharacterized protein n=1 Tax=Steinernema hermaphroditum TaxID=289476 RepID=A0AA39LY66_9BILA|nr:hypothetical protein QR680_006930 [Steinernema hermaphroditum]